MAFKWYISTSNDSFKSSFYQCPSFPKLDDVPSQVGYGKGLTAKSKMRELKQTEAAAANLQIFIQKDSRPSEFSRPLTSIILNLNGICLLAASACLSSLFRVFWLLWLCLKRYYSHFWHANAISHCADNGLVFWQKLFVSCQYACANDIFEKKLKTTKCSPNPKRHQIGIWTHLNMLYLNPTGHLWFCNFSIVYGPFIV